MGSDVCEQGAVLCMVLTVAGFEAYPAVMLRKQWLCVQFWDRKGNAGILQMQSPYLIRILMSKKKTPTVIKVQRKKKKVKKKHCLGLFCSFS